MVCQEQSINMTREENRIEGFLNHPSTNNVDTAVSFNYSPKTLWTRITQSRYFFPIAIALPIVSALIFFYSVDRLLLQKNVATGQQATTTIPVSSGNARLTTLSSVSSKGINNKEPSLSDLKAMSTSALASRLQSTSSEAVQKKVLSQTGRQFSRAQIEKAQRSAGSSSVLNKVDSARQSYSGSSSEAIAQIRNKLGN